MKFCNQLITIIENLHTKNKRNPHHGFQEKWKLVVGDNGYFLKKRTMDWDKNYKACSYWYYALPIQTSWESNLPIARYAHFNLCTFADKHKNRCVAAKLLEPIFHKIKTGFGLNFARNFLPF